MSLRAMAATLGASGIALGAFGAHAWKETLVQNGTLANFQTATIYQLFHATAVLAVACYSDSTARDPEKKSSSTSPVWCQRAGVLWTIGTLFFSGSIYCLCLKIGPKSVLGPITPLGGLFMIAGWVAVAL